MDAWGEKLKYKTMQVCKCKFFTLSFDYALLKRRIEDCFFSFQNTNNPKKTISNYFFQSYSKQTKLLIVTWKKKWDRFLKEKILLLVHTKLSILHVKERLNWKKDFFCSFVIMSRKTQEKTYNEHLKVYETDQESFLR